MHYPFPEALTSQSKFPRQFHIWNSQYDSDKQCDRNGGRMECYRGDSGGKRKKCVYPPRHEHSDFRPDPKPVAIDRIDKKHDRTPAEVQRNSVFRKPSVAYIEFSHAAACRDDRIAVFRIEIQ